MSRSEALGITCGLLAAGLSAVTATAAGFDYSKYFREPIGWPFTARPDDLKPNSVTGKPAVGLETNDTHGGSAAIRLDTAGCKIDVLCFNYQFSDKLIQECKGKRMVFSAYVKKVEGTSHLNIYQRNFGTNGFLSASSSASKGRKVGEWELLELRFVIPPLEEVTTVDLHSGVRKSREPTVLLIADAKLALDETPAGVPTNSVVGLEPTKGPLVLVQNGKPTATIVVATNATSTVRFAARELNRHLKACTGAKLPVVKEGAAVRGPTVHIGATALSERFGLAPRYHAPDSWAVWRVGDALVIAGGDSKSADLNPVGRNYVPLGTVYAAYEFLERALGVRWYWPGELGMVAPKRHTLSLGRVRWQGEPTWDCRHTYYCKPYKEIDPEESALWWMRMRHGTLGGGANANHAFNEWPGRYGKTHPEYFRVRLDGSRSTRTETHGKDALGGHVCLSNPDVLRLTIEDKRRQFDTLPLWIYQPVMPGDGDITCYCKECRAAERPERGEHGKHSDHVWSFVNKVAAEVRKTHPDRFITCMAYSSYSELPDMAVFEPNVAVTLGASLPFLAGSSGSRAGHVDRMTAWSTKSANLYIWDYWNVTRWDKGQEGAPAIYPHAIQQFFLSERGRVRGRFIEVHWAEWADFVYDSLNMYVAFRLMWNMDEDVDAMLDAFYRDFYGPAGPWVRRFYEEMEAAFFKRPKTWDWSAIWLDTYPPEFIAKVMGYLRRAETVTRGQEPYHTRAVKTLEGHSRMEEYSRHYTGGTK